MTTSREAFTEAYKQKFGFAPDMATPEAQMLLWAWQACDAHWREKLQSEEMVEVVEQYGYETALAAISKEMGV